MRGDYNKVPVSSGQCQVFTNEFILLDQVTVEFYLLDDILSKCGLVFVIFQMFERRSDKFVLKFILDYILISNEL